MTLLLGLRLLTLALWAVVFCLGLPSWFRILTGSWPPRQYDDFRSLVGGIALLQVMFVSRWFISADSLNLQVALYVLSITVAALTLLVTWTRGNAKRG